MSSKDIWVFGYGSLIWYRPNLKTIEEKIGYLPGWHRDWTWISTSRHGAPTCSLKPGGKVKGVFLKLDPTTQNSDLTALRKRELSSSEEIVEYLSGLSGKVYFWKMGDNLSEHNDTKGLKGAELYEAFARRARSISNAGPDGKTSEEYGFAVHEFDPDDELTENYVNEPRNLSEKFFTLLWLILFSSLQARRICQKMQVGFFLPNGLLKLKPLLVIQAHWSYERLRIAVV